MRLERATLGNLGDIAPVGAGVSEMRVHIGAGYRIYFVRHARTVVVLLCGGDKGSQARDIVQAQKLATEIEDLLKW